MGWKPGVGRKPGVTVLAGLSHLRWEELLLFRLQRLLRLLGLLRFLHGLRSALPRIDVGRCIDAHQGCSRVKTADVVLPGGMTLPSSSAHPLGLHQSTERLEQPGQPLPARNAAAQGFMRVATYADSVWVSLEKTAVPGLSLE